MLRDERAEFASTWAHEGCDNERADRIGTLGDHADRKHGSGRVGTRGEGDKHRQIDRELRRIAKQRAGLDVEEARWLREADRLQIWRKLGFSTALEYLEDVFGYAPRTAMERASPTSSASCRSWKPSWRTERCRTLPQRSSRES